MGFADSNGGFVPPDTTGAAGPTQVVEAINSSVAVYNKTTGNRLSLQSAATFMGLGSVQLDLFDPVVTYDEYAQRFIVVFLEQNDAASTSSVIIAVSNTSDASSGFTERQRINVRQVNSAGTAVWGDYPKIGYNREAYVVTLNMFGFNGGAFSNVQVVAIQKAPLLDRNPNTPAQTFSSNRPAGNFTLAAAVMHGAPANSPMWFAQSLDATDQVRITRMTNVLTNNPVYVDTDIAVNAFAQVPSVVQPGTGLLNAGDTRMLNAEWRGGQLVAAHTAGIGGEATARWYQFNVSNTPILVQQGNVDPGAGTATWFPSIALAPGGYIAMTYMQASATQPMSMFATGRAPNGAAGTMQVPRLIRAGAQNYNAFDGSPFRTGDYSATCVDPVNNSFWVFNEYATAAATNNFGTWIANVLVPGQPVGPLPPGPLVPKENVYPGRFIANGAETNDTSDKANSLGTVTRGTNGMNGLSIVRNALGLPDYDWYKFRIQRNGMLQVMNIITAGQPLEMSLWRRVGNDLVLIGRVRTNQAGFSRAIARVALGELIYVGIQGIQVGPGQASIAQYNMRFTLS